MALQSSPKGGMMRESLGYANPVCLTNKLLQLSSREGHSAGLLLIVDTSNSNVVKFRER